MEQYHKAGIAFASMNYRLSDVGPYPIMMQDCARGLQTIRHHAKKWNVNPKQIGCYGSSAGAGISLWLAFHDDLADPESEDSIARQSTRIVAAVTSNGQSTYDLRTYREWFGLPDLKAHEAMYPLYGVKQESDWESKRVQELMAAASPITHLSADDKVPVYMSYSRPNSKVDATTDQSVWVHHYRLGEKLQEAMQQLGLECHLVDRSKRRRDLKY
ncbi:MAG: alpha/beta hydrolase, partial [Planctomycetota bacterium]